MPQPSSNEWRQTKWPYAPVNHTRIICYVRKFGTLTVYVWRDHASANKFWNYTIAGEMTGTTDAYTAEDAQRYVEETFKPGVTNG